MVPKSAVRGGCLVTSNRSNRARLVQLFAHRWRKALGEYT